MRWHRSVLVPLALLALLALLGAACTSSDRGPTQARGGRSSSETEGAGTAEGLLDEAQEQADETAERLEALEAATAAGTVGRIAKIHRAPATGWTGEKLVNATGDDWEPAIAADPNASYVYILHNRYGASPCQGPCPDPAMIVHVSSDGGKTWGPEHFICQCKNVGGQFDPLIEVVRTTGTVYAVFMNDYKIQFSKSTDHGASWSTPVWIHSDVRWGDKPTFSTSANGQDVYVLFNGPSEGDVYAAWSHDGGTTWQTTQITNDARYHFDYGVAVLPTGRVVSTQISFSYTGQAGAATGPVQIHEYASDDGGVTWTSAIIDTLELGVGCTSSACYPDFYDSGPALAMDADGDLVVVYSGAATAGGLRTIYERSSIDDGHTWGARVVLSTAGVNAGFAAAAGVGNDGVRVYYAQLQSGRWNVFYRTSANLGGSWAAPVKISDATSGTSYKNASGFLEFYGDYGEIAVTNTGKAIGVWGEGPSYAGPGGVWVNVEK